MVTHHTWRETLTWPLVRRARHDRPATGRHLGGADDAVGHRGDEPDERPLEAPIGYDDLATALSEDLGRPVTEGVVVFTYSVESDSGDPGDVEVLCTLTITLSLAPPPTTTPTTTTTDVAEAAPRFTG